jgi:hypothetical protein
MYPYSVIVNLISNSYVSAIMFVCDVDVLSTKFNNLAFSTWREKYKLNGLTMMNWTGSFSTLTDMNCITYFAHPKDELSCQQLQ